MKFSKGDDGEFITDITANGPFTTMTSTSHKDWIFTTTDTSISWPPEDDSLARDHRHIPRDIALEEEVHEKIRAMEELMKKIGTIGATAPTKETVREISEEQKAEQAGERFPDFMDEVKKL